MKKAAIPKGMPPGYKSPEQLTIEFFFDRLFKQVNRLLEYPHWVRAERFQISFYSRKLRSLCEEFQSLKIKYQHNAFQMLIDITLKDLVNRLLEDKKFSMSNDSLYFSYSSHLTLVGDRLAVEVAMIYKALMHDSQEFGSCFCFDKNKQEGEVKDDGFCQRYYRKSFNSRYFEKNRLKEQVEGELFVGFQVEASNLLHQLASITRKHLEVISIVGMAGLGKTTLATRLYNHPYVVSYFYARAWVTFSHVYHKRDILLSILRTVSKITDDFSRMTETMLAQVLYRALKDRRYLIVVDDVWSKEAFDDFKRCFPNDSNGSRIMLTTRLKDIALHAQSDQNPLCLRFLTEKESFDLFRRKTLIKGDLFDDFSLIGMGIAKKCGGLPLAIVVIAGLLKNNFKIKLWAHVAGSVSSYIVTDENQYMNTLALSYNHLPPYLRPCFLSFGAFPKDHDIPVRRLIWLWMAEEFIHQDGTKMSLEDVAYEYLMDLTRRSLVVVGKKGSNGSIKTCHIHDLLHDLCLRKAQAENFSPNIYRYNKHSYSCPHCLTSPTKSQLLLSPDVLTIPSNCSCYSSEVSKSLFKDVSIVWDTSKLIRALDISSIELFVFPTELLQLVHLRYLELRVRSGNPPESISQLKELQTLVMSSRMNMVVPNNMWKLMNLKHLYIKSRENLLNSYNVEQELNQLENLLTLSLVSPTTPCEKILARAPNLQKLGLCGELTEMNGELELPDLGLLVHLETLKLLNSITPLCKAGRLITSIKFPASLKKFTVSATFLDWKEARVFEMMPNLEVLKLKNNAFVGTIWETSPEVFPRLKFLKLDDLDIETWTASRDHFPVLQRLQVYQCQYLIEIPEDFGNICTLEWIELSGCGDSAENSARNLQKEQESNGNDWLKILLNPGLTPS